jgi:hypothetical protein
MQLSRTTAHTGGISELRRRGYDARALAGGITAWHAIGGTMVPLDTSTYEGVGG